MNGHHSRLYYDNQDDDDDVICEPIRVPINIKLGSLGRGGVLYKDIYSLHDQTREMEVDMTWLAAIKKEFGMVLDHKRYYIRKQSATKSHHNLKTPIAKLLAEFSATPKLDWKVNIIDMIRAGDASTADTKHSRRDMRPASSSSHNDDARSPQKKKIKVEQDDDPKYQQFPTPIIVQTTSRNRKVRGAHVVPSTSKGEHRPRYIFENGNGKQNAEDDDINAMPHLEIQEYNHARRSSTYTKYNVVDDDNCSIASQDSQEDLDRLGIPSEDFKTVFIDRIRQYMSGDKLLEARDTLAEQKASQFSDKRDRWTKWAMGCPYPVAILRSLFDI